MAFLAIKERDREETVGIIYNTTFESRPILDGVASTY
jgi:hypothetical protein